MNTPKSTEKSIKNNSTYGKYQCRARLITSAKYVVAAYRVIKAVAEGDYRAAFSAATELLPLAKHLRNAAKLIDVAEKAEKLNRATQNIEDVYTISRI